VSKKSANLPDPLVGGEPARLFPVLADTSKEGRTVSILLACLAHVPDLARTLFDTLGQRLGSRSRLETFTEVELTNHPDGASDRLRPDGLIIIHNGRRSWKALVEAKVQKRPLEKEQVERYLKLARANDIDAVVTISNDFTAVPQHHPLRTAIRRLPKGVELFHWSWASIQTHAKVLHRANEVEDPDQQYILHELARFLEHRSAGVLRFDRMDENWKNLVISVAAGAKPKKGSHAVTETVANWHQECRDLALKLTEKVKTQVDIRLPLKHRKDSSLRIADESRRLCEELRLSVEFEVLNAAAPIQVAADLRARSIQCAMKIDAPEDRKSKARTTWLLRQLKRSGAADLHVKATWSGRTLPAQETLEAVRTKPDILHAKNSKTPPTAYQVLLIRDAGKRFDGPQTFIDELETTVERFYNEVGQHLKPWQPAAPKMVVEEGSTDSDAPKKIRGVAMAAPTPSPASDTRTGEDMERPAE